jgi:hypothetical protein
VIGKAANYGMAAFSELKKYTISLRKVMLRLSSGVVDRILNAMNLIIRPKVR